MNYKNFIKIMIPQAQPNYYNNIIKHIPKGISNSPCNKKVCKDSLLMSSDRLRDIINKHELDIANSPIEIAICIDKNTGKTLFKNMGTINEVSISEAPLGSIITHNHPGIYDGFSDSDVYQGFCNDAPEIRVVVGGKDAHSLILSANVDLKANASKINQLILFNARVEIQDLQFINTNSHVGKNINGIYKKIVSQFKTFKNTKILQDDLLEIKRLYNGCKMFVTTRQFKKHSVEDLDEIWTKREFWDEVYDLFTSLIPNCHYSIMPLK